MKTIAAAALLAFLSASALAAGPPPGPPTPGEADTKPGSTVGTVNWCQAYPNDHYVKTGQSTCPSRAPNAR